MKKEEEVILETDPDIVEFRNNVSGWVGKDGRFYGKDKAQAIYNNITHKKCDEGHVYKKYYIRCPECNKTNLLQDYKSKPFREWDYKTPICLFDDNQFFFSEDDIEDFLELNELKPEDLKLMYASPNYIQEVDSDILCEDIMPEGREFDEVASDNLLRALNKLNKLIKNHKPISWNQGAFRTEYKSKTK